MRRTEDGSEVDNVIYSGSKKFPYSSITTHQGMWWVCMPACFDDLYDMILDNPLNLTQPLL